ncbi:MAG: hypothetical protein ACO2ON_01635 [Candidatus Nanopusillus sp.]
MNKKIIKNLSEILAGITYFILLFSIIYYTIKNNLPISISTIAKIGYYIPPYIKILIMVLFIASLIIKLYEINKDTNIEGKDYITAIILVMLLSTLTLFTLYIIGISSIPLYPNSCTNNSTITLIIIDLYCQNFLNIENKK